MDVEYAYKELEAHLEEGKVLLRELDPEVGLLLEHLEWGEYAKTLIAFIDPHGKIYERSTPVGMFYDGWNIATFYIATQAQNDPTAKKKLIEWGESIGTATVTDVVKGAVKLAISSRNTHTIELDLECELGTN